MGHRLIIGRTGSGKSAIAKQIGSEIRNKGELIFAFNPMNERGYARRDDFDCVAADWETTDPDIFAANVRKYLSENSTRKLFLIIDECQNFFDRGDCKHLWIGTQGRHFGITALLISQRGVLVNPTVRGQCDMVYLFKCTEKDAMFVADEWGSKELRKAVDLQSGEYYRANNSGVTKFKLETGA